MKPKTQPIKVGDDVKTVTTKPTLGARTGAATAKGLNKSINAVTCVGKNIFDFGRCLWTGKAT